MRRQRRQNYDIGAALTARFHGFGNKYRRWFPTTQNLACSDRDRRGNRSGRSTAGAAWWRELGVAKRILAGRRTAASASGWLERHVPDAGIGGGRNRSRVFP